MDDRAVSHILGSASRAKISARSRCRGKLYREGLNEGRSRLDPVLIVDIKLKGIRYERDVSERDNMNLGVMEIRVLFISVYNIFVSCENAGMLCVCPKSAYGSSVFTKPCLE